MFDQSATESISFEDFKRVITHTQPVISCQFDFDSKFIKEYFGGDKKRQIGYLEFCELLHDFYEEQGLQAFRRCDSKEVQSVPNTIYLKYYISSPDWSNINGGFLQNYDNG